MAKVAKDRTLAPLALTKGGRFFVARSAPYGRDVTVSMAVSKAACEGSNPSARAFYPDFGRRECVLRTPQWMALTAGRHAIERVGPAANRDVAQLGLPA